MCLILFFAQDGYVNTCPLKKKKTQSDSGSFHNESEMIPSINLWQQQQQNSSKRNARCNRYVVSWQKNDVMATSVMNVVPHRVVEFMQSVNVWCNCLCLLSKLGTAALNQDSPQNSVNVKGLSSPNNCHSSSCQNYCTLQNSEVRPYNSSTTDRFWWAACWPKQKSYDVVEQNTNSPHLPSQIPWTGRKITSHWHSQ